VAAAAAATRKSYSGVVVVVERTALGWRTLWSMEQPLLLIWA